MKRAGSKVNALDSHSLSLTCDNCLSEIYELKGSTSSTELRQKELKIEDSAPISIPPTFDSPHSFKQDVFVSDEARLKQSSEPIFYLDEDDSEPVASAGSPYKNAGSEVKRLELNTNTLQASKRSSKVSERAADALTDAGSVFDEFYKQSSPALACDAQGKGKKTGRGPMPCSKLMDAYRFAQNDTTTTSNGDFSDCSLSISQTPKHLSARSEKATDPMADAEMMFHFCYSSSTHKQRHTRNELSGMNLPTKRNSKLLDGFPFPRNDTAIISNGELSDCSLDTSQASKQTNETQADVEKKLFHLFYKKSAAAQLQNQEALRKEAMHEKGNRSSQQTSTAVNRGTEPLLMDFLDYTNKKIAKTSNCQPQCESEALFRLSDLVLGCPKQEEVNVSLRPVSPVQESDAAPAPVGNVSECDANVLQVEDVDEVLVMMKTQSSPLKPGQSIRMHMARHQSSNSPIQSNFFQRFTSDESKMSRAKIPRDWDVEQPERSERVSLSLSIQEYMSMTCSDAPDIFDVVEINRVQGGDFSDVSDSEQCSFSPNLSSNEKAITELIMTRLKEKIFGGQVSPTNSAPKSQKKVRKTGSKLSNRSFPELRNALTVQPGEKTIFDFSCTDIYGKQVNLDIYKSSPVVLVVNVASRCEYARPNYKQLHDLYKQFHLQGLEILAFPCNQFANQEPWENPSIIKHVTSQYGISFPLFSKVEVNGPTQDPLFEFLKHKTNLSNIPWNFTKFLVVAGVPLKHYSSNMASQKIVDEIEFAFSTLKTHSQKTPENEKAPTFFLA